MRNLWQDRQAQNLKSDLDLRVYTSNLLGRSDELVLHGGGNTSVKSMVDGEEILYVKGSGWDLVSIQAQGFAPVKMSTLLELSKAKNISDSEMVRIQKSGMIDPDAPNPSVEAILHAIIPFKFVDHTHADAIVTISNSQEGKAHIKKLFPNFLIVPYVMPGFILAQTIVEMTQWYDWEHCEGIILHNHGIFTFDNDAKKSYDKMIEAVSHAEAFLGVHAPLALSSTKSVQSLDLEVLGDIMAKVKGYRPRLKLNQSALAKSYASQPNLCEFARRGVLTPEHILRTKREPLVLESSSEEAMSKAVDEYICAYEAYFSAHATDEICLNPAPNYAVVKDEGIVIFSKDEKEERILNDIIEHTMTAVLRADALGGFESITQSESFAMEYWELEQMKLKVQNA